MIDARFDDGGDRFTSGEDGARFFEAPFLREMLNDVTLALDLGRPVFLLGAGGSGKSALGGQAAVLLGQRYGVARLAGRRTLGLDDVVESCRQGFAPDVWQHLSPPRSRDTGRPGDSAMIVDDAETIPPRFIEQLIAMSNGSPDLLPSHRIFFIGREALADVIETGRVRNNWGVPLVLAMPPWPTDVAVPFLRHRLRSAGLGDCDLLSDAAIAAISADAKGNPGRLLDLAQRILQPDAALEWIEPPAQTRPVIGRASTTIDLEPAAVLFAEPPPVFAPGPPPAAGLLARWTRRSRRALHLALPVGVVIAAGLLVWAFDQPPPAPRPKPVSALVAAPVPDVVASPEPAAVVPPPPIAAPLPARPTIPAEALIARGDSLLAGGDFEAARLFYLQAVESGSAKAATAVAKTYDPLALDRLGGVGGHGEPAKAAEWYRKAVDLGDPAAAEPLRRLTSP